METNLNGAKENAPQPVARHKRGTSTIQNPQYKPKLRSFQAVKPQRDRQTVGRSFRPFGDSELRVTVLTKNGYPTIRISTIEGAGRNRRLDLRKSDIPGLIKRCRLTSGRTPPLGRKFHGMKSVRF